MRRLDDRRLCRPSNRAAAAETRATALHIDRLRVICLRLPCDLALPLQPPAAPAQDASDRTGKQQEERDLVAHRDALATEPQHLFVCESPAARSVRRPSRLTGTPPTKLRSYQHNKVTNYEYAQSGVTRANTGLSRPPLCISIGDLPGHVCKTAEKSGGSQS